MKCCWWHSHGWINAAWCIIISFSFPTFSIIQTCAPPIYCHCRHSSEYQLVYFSQSVPLRSVWILSSLKFFEWLLSKQVPTVFSILPSNSCVFYIFQKKRYSYLKRGVPYLKEICIQLQFHINIRSDSIEIYRYG